MPRTYFTHRQLLDRGWSRENIGRVFRKPSRMFQSPVGEVRFYSSRKVAEAELYCLPVVRQLQAYWAGVAMKAAQLLETHTERINYLQQVLANSKGRDG